MGDFTSQTEVLHQSVSGESAWLVGIYCASNYLMYASDPSGTASEAEASETELDPAAVKQLKRELERERYRNAQLNAQLKRQTKLNEQQQLQAEQEEEYITNKLMKRLTVLKHEKEHLARQVEMEEEMITNKLSKKLEKVKQEKVNLENLLEQEQEYIVNKLQKQLSQVLDEKRALEAQLRDNTGTILQTLQQHLERWRERPGQPATTLTSTAAELADAEAGNEVQRTHLLVKHLAQEIDALGEQQEKCRLQCEAEHQQNEQLNEELARLQGDNSCLLRRIAREREIRETAQGEKARLETELELDSERAFNSVSTRSSVASSPAMTASLAPLSPRLLTPGLLGAETLPPTCHSPMIVARSGSPKRTLSPRESSLSQ